MSDSNHDNTDYHLRSEVSKLRWEVLELSNRLKNVEKEVRAASMMLAAGVGLLIGMLWSTGLVKLPW